MVFSLTRGKLALFCSSPLSVRFITTLSLQSTCSSCRAFRIGFVSYGSPPGTPISRSASCRELGLFRTWAPLRNWLCFAQLLPGGASRPRPPAPIPGHPGKIGFVLHDQLAGAPGSGAGSRLSTRRSPSKLGSFCIFRPLAPCPGRAELGLFRTKVQGSGTGCQLADPRPLKPDPCPNWLCSSAAV